MITVYTANLGQFDNLRAPDCDTSSADWLCYTDQPLAEPRPWRCVPAYTAIPGDGARNVRMHKLMPHLFATHDGDTPAEFSIWHDANFVLKRDPAWIVQEYLQATGADIAVFRHPARQCLYAEADLCVRENIEKDHERLAAQLARYRAAGFPNNAGLAACGIMVRRNSEKVRRFGETWWREVLHGSKRDQISFMFAAIQHELLIHWIPGNIHNNDLAGFYFHAAWVNQPCNQEFAVIREARAKRLSRMAELCIP